MKVTGMFDARRDDPQLARWPAPGRGGTARLASAQLFQVDAFASRAFEGNPAAVCILDARREAEWMQRVAAEMNLSETAFLVRTGGRWSLRWFTPRAEVALCGHATLAAAHVLWDTARAPERDPLYFETRSGTLTARRRCSRVEIDLPARPVQTLAVPPREVLEALGEGCGPRVRRTDDRKGGRRCGLSPGAGARGGGAERTTRLRPFTPGRGRRHRDGALWGRTSRCGVAVLRSLVGHR